MITVPVTQFLHNFSLYCSTAGHGTGVLATFHGRPLCLAAPPGILSDDEAALAVPVSATNAYHNLSELTGLARDGRVMLITSHGRLRCCLVPPHFAGRLPPG